MKWINISPAGESATGKTQFWRVETKDGGVLLGHVSWWPRWRKYVFNPASSTLFEQDCLRDIAEFCESATRSHYENLKAAKGPTEVTPRLVVREWEERS